VKTANNFSSVDRKAETIALDDDVVNFDVERAHERALLDVMRFAITLGSCPF
jgi:hypothetical protein